MKLQNYGYAIIALAWLVYVVATSQNEKNADVPLYEIAGAYLALTAIGCGIYAYMLNRSNPLVALGLSILWPLAAGVLLFIYALSFFVKGLDVSTVLFRKEQVRCRNCGCLLVKQFINWDPVFPEQSACAKDQRKCVPQIDPK